MFDRVRNPAAVANPTGQCVDWEISIGNGAEGSAIERAGAFSELCASLSRAAVEGGSLEEGVANSTVVITMTSQIESALRTIDRFDRAMEKMASSI